MRIILLGPPGSGKGSLASLCDNRLGIRHISTGEIFRREIARKSVLGRRVAKFVTSGRLVPDRVVVQVMAARLSHKCLADGFILDGFPRTAGQAVGFDRFLKQRRTCLDGAVYVDVVASVLVRRLSGRRVCVRCGANYNVRTMPPRRAGRCDRCAGRLAIRKDDEPRTIRKRLSVDRRESRPMSAYYKKRCMLHRLNGVGSLETVFGRFKKLCRREGWL